MAKMYYSEEETVAKLGCTAEKLRELAKEGRLREFRDGGKLSYRVDEVDQLASESGGGEGGDTGELTLSLEDSGSDMPSAESGGGADADKRSGSSSGTGELSLADSGSGSPFPLTDDTEEPSPGGSDTPLNLDIGSDAPIDLGSDSSVPLLEDSDAPLLQKKDQKKDSAGSTPPSGEDAFSLGAGSGSGEFALDGSGSGSSGLTLEDTDTGADSGTKSGTDTPSGDMVSLDEVDKDAVEGMKKDDTVITNIGISVFDDDDLEIAADPMAKTMLTGGDDHLGLDGSGGGSGLLDLTRESDDTSLGAELLEGIDLGDTAETEAAPIETEPAEGDEEEVLPEPEMEAGPSPAMIPVSAAGYVEPVSPAFTGLLIAATLVMALAAALTMANLQSVWPSYMDSLAGQFWIVLGASIGLGGLLALVGYFVGRPAAPKKPKAPKPKKEKTKKGK